MESTAEHLYNISQSYGYKLFIAVVIILAVVLLAAVIVFAIKEGLHGILRYKEGTDSDKWLIVISTLRDTFSITAIYICLDLLRYVIQYQESSTPINLTLAGYILLATPFLEFTFYCFLALIVTRRLKVLSAWLAKNASSQ